MDMSTQLPMAGYFIYRSGEQADPTALEFCPPKGSDELFFALKVAYPHVKTHSDRMRNAVIEFLKQELAEEQTMAAPAIPMDSDLNYDLSTESPWSSWPSMDSTTSTLSSPDILNLATPASMTSSYAPTMSRQDSSSQANASQKAKPGLEEMTGVFSLSSTSQPKTRVRRKMTESEKLEYRKRRIVKACDSCSKRKRKCSHNQPEMEKVRSSKVTKPKVAAASTIHPARVEQIEKAVFQPAKPAILAEDPFMFLDQSLFSELPSTDPLFLDNAGTYNLFEPQASQASEQVSSTAWPWSDTPDWTLIDTPLLTQASPSSPSYHQALFPASTGLLSPQPTPQLELMHEPAEQVDTRESPTTEQTPTRTWRTFSDFSRTAFSTADGLDGKEQSASMGLSTPGDMMPPSQLRDQHSSSATLLGTQSSLSSSDSRRERSTMPSGSQQTLSQLVPQADGLTSTIRPEGQRLQGNGRIGGSGLINGLSHAISPQVTIAQSGEGLRHVMSEGAASSPTTLGDRRIGNPINASITAAVANATHQRTAMGRSSTSPSTGLSSIMATASDQSLAPIAERRDHGLSNTLKKQPTTSDRSVSRGGLDDNGEAPSAARPSSLSADSTSTSSSSSISRTAPSDPRPRSQAASPDLHGGLAATASTPSTPFHKNAHDEDPGHQTSVTQTKARPDASSDEMSPMLSLKSGARSTHGHGRMSAVAASASDDAKTISSSAPTALQAVSANEQPLRHRLKRSPGRSLAPATSASLEATTTTCSSSSTSLAAAVLVAQVCMTWRAMATAFVQATSIRDSCGINDRDSQSLPMNRTAAVLVA
ncbi:hypothetical protein D6D13_01064 [Aureobasidium pullulans]|uniref:Uncharacterized protein n=1 Tax=Aureobasidium pullulans TaxID=5580 RepID=A0A4S9DAM5_AURPU|nr:hypothetical protein D6D13_01064 [Aureobasidium pullulans]